MDAQAVPKQWFNSRSTSIAPCCQLHPCFFHFLLKHNYMVHPFEMLLGARDQSRTHTHTQSHSHTHRERNARFTRKRSTCGESVSEMKEPPTRQRNHKRAHPHTHKQTHTRVRPLVSHTRRPIGKRQDNGSSNSSRPQHTRHH